MCIVLRISKRARKRAMAYGCKSSVGCIDARIPIRANYTNLYKWPESDAEFVKSMIINEKNQKKLCLSPLVVDSYSCRQMYLRSYTFSKKKESMYERMRKCLANLPFIVNHRKSESNSSITSVDSKRKKMWRRKKKSCVTVKKSRKVSCDAVRLICGRLFSCTTSVKVY